MCQESGFSRSPVSLFPTSHSCMYTHSCVQTHAHACTHTYTHACVHTHNIYTHTNTHIQRAGSHTDAHTCTCLSNQSPSQATQAFYISPDAVAFSFPSWQHLPQDLIVFHLTWPIDLLAGSLRSMLQPAARGNFIQCKLYLRGEGKREKLRGSKPPDPEQAQLPREVLGDPANAGSGYLSHYCNCQQCDTLYNRVRGPCACHLLHPDLSGTVSWEAEAPSTW